MSTVTFCVVMGVAVVAAYAIFAWATAELFAEDIAEKINWTE